MRVRIESTEYTHTDDKGKPKAARAYALVSDTGKPIFAGLFIDEAKAEAYCKARGWRLVK